MKTLKQLESELFNMVYQWGQVGLQTDERCNAFQKTIGDIKRQIINAMLVEEREERINKGHLETQQTTNKLPNFKGLKKCYVVEVLEGEGTEASVRRIINYVYDENLEPIGKIDFIESQQKF